MTIDRNYWRCSYTTDSDSHTTTVKFDKEDRIVVLTDEYDECVYITIDDLIEIVEAIKNG
jgi:hypothetical protein